CRPHRLARLGARLEPTSNSKLFEMLPPPFGGATEVLSVNPLYFIVHDDRGDRGGVAPIIMRVEMQREEMNPWFPGRGGGVTEIDLRDLDRIQPLSDVMDSDRNGEPRAWCKATDVNVQVPGYAAENLIFMIKKAVDEIQIGLGNRDKKSVR